MNLKVRSVYFVARTMGVFPFWIAWKLGLISASHYALICDCVLVSRSPLFDAKWYYSRYPGVARSGMPAGWHYCKYGWREGRGASATFSGEKYLEANPDVRKANVNPLAHYIRVGRREGRSLSIRPENRNLQPVVVAQAERFCPARYCALYRDVDVVAQKDKSYPEEHYFKRGKRMGRSNGYDAPQARGGGPLFTLEPGGVPCDPAKPNCVIVAHESSRTGCPINTWSMLRELRARYNVLAFSLKRGVLDDLFRGEATWYGSFHEMVRENEAYLELALADVLDARAYDFAIVNSVVCHAALAAFAWHRIPTVVCIHEFAQYCTPAQILDCFLYGTQVVYSSKACLDATRARIRAEAADVPIIPQGKSALPVDSKARLGGRELYHITRLTALRRDKGEFVVLGCGTVEYRKGFDLFLRAAASLRRKCPEHRFRFVWTGGGYAPEKKFLSRMYAAEIEMLGLGDVLDILGSVEFMDRFYALSDLFLLPSVLDPLPGVVIEAMSHRLPVICFDGASGFPEMFRAEGLDGFCVARCLDADDMAEKAAGLARDDEARKRLGEALYAFYVRTFDMPAYVGRICEVANGARARYADFLSRHGQCGRDRFLLALRAESARREGILNSSVTQVAALDHCAMTPTLFGLEARIEKSEILTPAELCSLAGGNTGNLAFNYAIVRELEQRPEVRPWHGRGPDVGMGIISCANQLGQHCNMADALSWPWLNKPDFPVVAIGLGAQSRKKTGPGVLDYETPYLHPATVEWVRRMVEHAPSEYPNISVRGEFTRRVMEELGFGKNVETLGCPTLFISPDERLGESIARKCGRFDRIALAAGQKGWTSIAPLENSLAKIITACDGAFVAQADVTMIQTALGGYAELDGRTRDGIRRHFRDDLDEGQFAEWCKRFGHVFFDVEEWMAFYRQFDFVIGPRIHGTMIALQAGVPAMCVAIDSRTTELCEIMKVPYVPAEAVKDGVSLEQIKRLFRFDPQEFDRNRIMLAQRFSKFLVNNKLIPSASLAAIAAQRSS